MKHELTEQMLDILSRCQDMTVATVRPDGAPQATVVSFVHDGLTVYFLVGETSQKAANLSRDPRVSLTVTPHYDDWLSITGLSIFGHANEVTAEGEVKEIVQMMVRRFPDVASVDPADMAKVKFFRVRPEIVSVLDYTKGFGHTETASVGGDDIAESLETMRHKWMVPADAAG